MSKKPSKNTSTHQNANNKAKKDKTKEQHKKPIKGRPVKGKNFTGAKKFRISKEKLSLLRGRDGSWKDVKGPSKVERPSWRQSEKDVSNANPDYETQKSFKNGEEVPYGTKGSVRPDNYKEGASIEVKNYDVTTASGRNRLVDNITKQVEQRVEHLPADTSQKIVIDVRGQNVSNDALREIRDSIVSKTGENVEIQFLR